MKNLNKIGICLFICCFSTVTFAVVPGHPKIDDKKIKKRTRDKNKFLEDLFKDIEREERTSFNLCDYLTIRRIVGVMDNCMDDRKMVPLHFAAIHGRHGWIKFLLSLKAEVNVKDGEGNTPLHYASAEGHLEIAKKLVAAKANINSHNKLGHTPLHEAIRNRRLAVVEFLLGKGVIIEEGDKSIACILYHLNQDDSERKRIKKLISR
jgi:hypothetical protein